MPQDKLTEKKVLVRNKNIEKHLFISDFQIPDHNAAAIKVVTQFMHDFSPDVLHLVGDMMNFSLAGNFSIEGGYDVSIGDEIRAAKIVIGNIVLEARKTNPKVRVIWYEGNHEYRLERYLAKNADQLIDLTDDDGDRIVSIPYLFKFKENKIEWVPYYGTYREKGNTEVEHGDIARSKSGYTAHGMLDKRGRSGYSGHTHKLALVSRNQGGDVKFWVETGSLCNPEPTPRWAKKPDWVNGFAVGIYDKKNDIMHPTPILMQKNTFVFGDKLYK